MSLGPLGMNSGMDINSMVSKIVDAERVPKQQRIDSQRTENSASISAYGRLRESLDSMKTLMMNFRQNEAFATRKVDSSDDGVVAASATTDAIAGKYSIDVMQLAQSHKVASDVLSEDEKFGPGKLHISLGDTTYTVDVQANAKLRDVVNGINQSKGNPGIRASIINDADGPRLIVAAEKSGKNSRILIDAEASGNNPLKKLEYKTLEQRVKDIEKARAEAQQLLSPLTPEEQKIASKVAEKIELAARAVDESMAQELNQAGEQTADGSESKSDPLDPNADQTALQAANQAKTNAQNDTSYLPPEERIPGWSETASGTLLDSYKEPVPELDPEAQEKAQQVPGWSNTASGTLYDSYVTPEEAKAQIEEKLAAQDAKVQQALQGSNLTPEQAKEIVRQSMTPEELAYLDKLDAVNAKLSDAQSDFDTYTGMSEVQAAQDSEVMLDGIAKLSSDNNIIEDAIEGVDLALKGVTKKDQKSAEINIEYDRDTVRSDIEQFVTSYNQFYQLSKQLTSVDPQTGEAGPLSGDSVVRSADSRLKRVFSQAIDGAPQDMNSLTAFGITTTRQGTLEINYDLLDRQLNNNFEKLGEFFGGRKGFAKNIEDAIQGLTGSTGPLRTREQSIQESNRRLDTSQTDLDRRMGQLEKRMQSKFQAMQDATGKMQSQLSGMMNALGQ